MVRFLFFVAEEKRNRELGGTMAGIKEDPGLPGSKIRTYSPQ
jgi:hypothetical protein